MVRFVVVFVLLLFFYFLYLQLFRGPESSVSGLVVIIYTSLGQYLWFPVLPRNRVHAILVMQAYTYIRVVLNLSCKSHVFSCRVVMLAVALMHLDLGVCGWHELESLLP